LFQKEKYILVKKREIISAKDIKFQVIIQFEDDPDTKGANYLFLDE
jgi:hypothetical protein